MSLKIEVILAILTLVTSVAGGLYTSVYRTGQLNDRVDVVAAHQIEQDKHIDQNSTDTTNIRIQDSAIKERLDAMKEQLDRIERAVK